MTLRIFNVQIQFWLIEFMFHADFVYFWPTWIQTNILNWFHFNAQRIIRFNNDLIFIIVKIIYGPHNVV